VKSAILLAGLTAGVSVALTEPGASRDHTERMLRECGVAVSVAERGAGRRVEMVDPPGRIPPLDFDVPGDLSSAAFLVLAALLGVGGGELTVTEVGLNPTRSGVLTLLDRMGAGLRVDPTPGTDRGEPTGSVTARPAALRAIEVAPGDVVAAIDEIPVVAVAAARAAGTTRITGAAELRVKETDRIRALVVNLRAVGVRAEELDDGLEIEGSDRPLAGTVDAFDDHRIAMAFGVLGAQAGNDIRVEGAGAVEVSWPGFWDALEALRDG
jgi:3-phosphoshikimate 1-carboxyvinyltransferase